MGNERSEELIERQMEETRASLTEKIESLESKVVGTVENATTAVNQTVDAIKDTVHDTVATVQGGVKESVDSVKDLVDVPAQVQRRPWLMFGGAVAVGYCLGTLLKRNAAPQYVAAPIAPPPSRSMAPLVEAMPAQARLTAAAPAEPSMWAPEVAKLKGLALGVLFGTARELVVSSLPEHMGDQVRAVVDSVTKKVGGEPLPSSDWAALCEPTQLPSDPVVPSTSTMSPQQSAAAGNGHHGARRW